MLEKTCQMWVLRLSVLPKGCLIGLERIWWNYRYSQTGFSVWNTQVMRSPHLQCGTLHGEKRKCLVYHLRCYSGLKGSFSCLVEITCPLWGWPKPPNYNTAETCCKLMSQKVNVYILLSICAKLLSECVLNVTFTWSLKPNKLSSNTKTSKCFEIVIELW